MKKFLIIFIALFTFTSAALADAFSRHPLLRQLKAGTYTCPYEKISEYSGKVVSNYCKISIKNGYGMSGCPDDDNITVKLIKSGKCKFEPYKETIYSCQYPKGSCSVTISTSGKSAYCSGEVPKNEKGRTDYDRIYAEAKTGKCYKQ